MINARQLSQSDYAARARFVSAYFEESGNIRQTIYADSVGVPTIGIGFNLRVTNSLNEVLETFGFDLVSSTADRGYRDRLAAVFAANTPSSWQSQADAIMAERANAVGGAARSIFEFFNDQEIYATFDELIVTYENQAASLGPNAPLSFERLAIVDMAYNGILSSSNKFRAAFDAGDRAEAWYEVTFNSNYGQARANSGTGIMRRRYLEGELFGLYDKDGSPPSEAEALRIFRMVNKHENQINGEIAAFPRALGLAQTEWNAMLAAFQAAYGEAFGATRILPLGEELAPAATTLIDAYVNASPLAGVTNAPTAFSFLLTYSPTQIFVAADVRGTNPFHAAEVAAHTVDRNARAVANDLIFGALAASGGLGANVADTLRGAGGADWFVSGGGGDLIDGGTGIDVVDYSNSPAAVAINLQDGFVEAGGDAQGDSLAAVEAILGTAFGDTLTGDGADNLFAGGAGADSVVGAGGADFAIGGADADTVYGNAGGDWLDGGADRDYLNGGGGHDRLFGSNGNDTIRGATGWDVIFGGKGFDYLRGGDEPDVIDGGELDDTILGETGDDTVAGGDGDDDLFGGAGADTFEFARTGDVDAVHDFAPGPAFDDRIRLLGFGAAFDTFAEVLAAATDNGVDTTISFGGGDFLILKGVLIGQLSADDFTFG